jgi:hypothetical protein
LLEKDSTGTGRGSLTGCTIEIEEEKLPGGEVEDSPFLKMISIVPSTFLVNSGSVD